MSVRAEEQLEVLPTGTVTFLMTDVEGSMPSWDADADEMDASLVKLDETIRSVVGRTGVVIKSRGEGDSHFVAFDRPSEAIVAAYKLQLALASSIDLRVRAAVHTGEARVRDGDYFGVAANRAARLRSTAHGGQIVVSRVSADLADSELPDEIELVPLGIYRIHDWPRAEQIFGVRGPGISCDFPTLRVLGDARRPLMTVVVLDTVGWTNSIRDLTEPELVTQHRVLSRRLREEFRAHGGNYLKLMGDGALTAFEDPAAALNFARAMCDQPDAPMRAGVQIGVLEQEADEVIGWAIYTSFALTAQAKPGEIRTTRTVSELLAGQAFCFTPSGEEGKEPSYIVT